MTAPVPEARGLFDESALAHVSYLDDAGQIVTFPMWVDFAEIDRFGHSGSWDGQPGCRP